MTARGNIAPSLMRTLLTGERMAVAERFRTAHNSLALAPSMRAILDDALIAGLPVTQMERKYGWPNRSAKAIIGVLLDILGEAEGKAATPDNGAAPPARRLLEHLTATGFDPDVAAHMTRFGLNKGEARLLEIIRRAPDMIISRDAAMARLYPDDDDPPDIKIIDVRMSSLRQKLACHGIKIKTLWGIGWKLHWPHDVPAPVPDAAPGQREATQCPAPDGEAVTDAELLDYIAMPDADRRVAAHMARFGLSLTEAKLFDALHQARARPLNKADLHQKIYQEDADAPSVDGTRSLILHTRRKLAPHGWRIKSDWGEGWRLIPPPDDTRSPPQVDGQEVLEHLPTRGKV